MSAPSDEPAESRAARLERGELHFWPQCPWDLPSEPDLEFLRGLRLRSRHKNISFDPSSNRVGGFAPNCRATDERLRTVLARFSRSTAEWLGRWLPWYEAAWSLDRASFRPEEEATRAVR